jgi:1-acyl-sn-glycerol-3-phosphate acyltransferase
MKNVSKIWSKTTLFGLKYICDLSYKIEGEIPKEPVLFVSKHQSAFECLIYLAELDYPKFVLKRELVRVPFAGLYFILMDMIVIDRSSVKDAMVKLPLDVKKSIVEDKRSVLLFPEGTRLKYGEESKCKGAINFIQKSNDYTKICPIVINTGKFWGKNSFIKRSGVATIRFLPPLDVEENYKTINVTIEKIFNESGV